MTLNLDQAQHNNAELTRDARKELIRDALKEGPAFADGIAKRLGERSNKEFVSLLHEMLDDMEISFSWLRGYSA